MSRRGRTLLVAEAALWLLTAAAIVGMHRLFEDGSYRPALLVQATVAHLTVALLRRQGVRLVPAALVTAGVGLLTMTWVYYASTTTWLLPGGATWRAAGDDLVAAWRVFQRVDAPAPVETGFLLAGSVALWLMVYVADWAAFRATATFEALLPSATLFLFAAALGAPGGRVAGATLYAASAMLFVLLQRTLNQEDSSTWAASHRTRGRWSLLGTGAALIAVTVVAGAVAGPNLPGAGARPVIDWQNLDDEDETRVVISPMVDLQTRLVDQPDVEVFTVRSPETPNGAYWRLTALDEFDGQIWRSSYATNDAAGSLPQEVESSVPTETARQTFSVANLAAVWLPAAFEPVAIDGGDNEVDWDAESSTLIVDRSLDSSDGFTYEVESEVPQWTAEQMRTASGEVPDEIAERYLQVPDVDERVNELAHDLTDGVSSPYDKALALMSHLRGPEFTYDLEAPPGHSTDALTSFLFDTQRGYCEQFAGAFAVMARLIDLPSRVVVGFTPGTRDAEDATLWHVTGRQAHAWAEVYLDGFGWVMIDPTPGRAPPGAEAWLGITPEQGTDGGATGAGAAGAAGAPAGQVPTAPAGGASGDEQRTGANGLDRGQRDGISNAGDQGAEISDSMRRVLLAIALAALAYLLLVPAAVASQPGLRRRRAQLPADRVRLAWREAIDRAAAAGVELSPSLTITEASERLTAAVPGAGSAVRHLAATMEHVMYAEVAPSPEEAERALAARDAIVDEVREREPVMTRVLRYFDVRELWRWRAQPARRRARSRPAPAVGL